MYKNRFVFLLRLTLLLFVFFWVSRLLFFAFQYEQTFKMGIGNFVGSFVYGMRLDLSITGYVLLLASFLIGATFSAPPKRTRCLFDVIIGLCLVVFSLIVIVDGELYRHWGYRMDTSALGYLDTPGEMFASVPLWQTFVFVGFWIGYSSLFVWIYKKWVSILIPRFEVGNWKVLPLFVVVAATMILPIRGQLGIAPINTGMVYFSRDLFVNHSAVNVVWNFFYDLANVKKSKLKFTYTSVDEAKQVREKWVTVADSSTKVLAVDRPNVLFIILESFSARVVEPLGGKPGITPRLNSLWNEGIGFTHFYATGLRSDRGLVAIFSGYPSHPKISSMKYPQKTQKMPSIARRLQDEGYSTSFYYGGDTNFANMHSYLVNSGFQRIVNQGQFPKEFRNSKWGVHDGVMFDRLLADTDTAKAPFFTAFFTLSSHEPFDVPMETKIKGDDPSLKYLNSIVYSDSCLGAFIDKAKKSKWWNNTLIVLVADHSVRFPENLAVDVPIRYSIPMLWLGGAVSRPMTWKAIGSQTDIASTVLNQLDVRSDDFYFSNDLFNPDRKEFATYIYNRGYGMVTDKGTLVYDFERDKFTIAEGDTIGLAFDSKALFQHMVDDFNGL
ncbi:MAG: sulfatase-like hydrolase/transferase [Breznakibacter sp.]